MTAAVGHLLDSIGVPAPELEEGHLAVEALVLIKVVDDEGGVVMHRTWSPGCDWLARRGLLTAALEADANALRNA